MDVGNNAAHNFRRALLSDSKAKCLEGALYGYRYSEHPTEILYTQHWKLQFLQSRGNHLESVFN